MKINKENSIKDTFSVPENYFHNFAKDMETKISEAYIKELCGNKSPFSVPRKYFENYSFRVKKSKFSLVLRTLSGVAAAILIAFTIQQVLFSSSEIIKNNVADEILIEDAELYSDAEIYDSETIMYLDIEEDIVEDIQEETNETDDETENSEELEYLADYADYLILAEAY